MLAKLSRRERTILYLLAAVAALSLFYNFLIEPLIKRWNEVNQQSDLVKGRLLKSLSVIKEKDRIDKEYAVYAERLRPRGSDEQEMTDILNRIERLAHNANLKIVNIKPKPAQEKTFYKRFMVGIETESNMNSLMKFIYDLKNSPLLLKVDRLNLNAKSGRTGVIIRTTMAISKVSIK